MATDPNLNDDLIRQLIATLGASVHHANNNVASLAQGMWQSQQNAEFTVGQIAQVQQQMSQGFAAMQQGTAAGSSHDFWSKFWWTYAMALHD